MHRLVCGLLVAMIASAADPAASAQQKLDSITQDRAAAGSTIVFSPAECNAWAHAKLPGLVPNGIRNEHLDLGTGIVTATALVDFVKVRQSLGKDTGLLLRKLLEGERPVKAIVRVDSANGQATVSLTRVEVGNAAATGGLLEILIQNVVRPVYPAAKIDEPIDLDNRIDRIEIRPTGIRVTIKK